MVVSLITTTYVASITFILLALIVFGLLHEYEKDYRNIISGGLAWSLVALMMLIPFSFIMDASHISNYEEIFDSTRGDNRSLTFWVLALFSFATEITRARFTSKNKAFSKGIRGSLLFGVGWGVAEFITPFLYFFEDGEPIENKVAMFLLILILNVNLTIIVLRYSENSKFIMFAIFIRFFFELAVFGGFGNIFTEFTSATTTGKVIQNLYFIAILQIMIAYLTYITRKVQSDVE